MATIIAILIASWIWFLGDVNALNNYPLPTLMNATGLFVLFLSIYLQARGLNLLQKTEKNFVPRITEIWKHEFFAFLFMAITFAFPLLSLGLSLPLGFPITFQFLVWVILFGLTIDGLLYTLQTMYALVDPFHASHLVEKHAYRSSMTGNIPEFCQWIESLSDSCIRGIHDANMGLARSCLTKMDNASQHFIRNNSPLTTPQNKEEEIIYVICQILQHFETIHLCADEVRQEVVASQVVLSLGKLAHNVAKFFPVVAHLPINSIGQLAIESVHQGLEEVGTKASLTLQETAKAILEDDPKMELPIWDMFRPILDQLEGIAQATFQQNREVNISTLTKPIREIRDLFVEGKYAKHPDAPRIKDAAGNVLATFETLETVLQTMPHISGQHPPQKEPEKQEKSTTDEEELNEMRKDILEE
ncbi:MAG: hypothetical protein Tsb0021_03260 [Chlamydiales bacterium]